MKINTMDKRTNEKILTAPAFPLPENVVANGISIRLYLMTRAPKKIPGWFSPPDPPYTKPQKPKVILDNKGDEELFMFWCRDPIEDLPDHLADAQKEWEAYGEAFLKWQLDCKAWTYFQWRRYYAEQIINFL
jgi:hypothetical protein